ncbi:MAG: tetratricopeptide repeat protein, partial [Anaerolineae bacterium]
MSTALLTTKLQPPPRRAGTVRRTRLIERLNAHRERKLTLLSAPAGFGKTTLLAGWLADEADVGWLTLDATDNDPVRFWTYVLTALRSTRPDLGRTALRILQPAGTIGPAARLPIEPMLTLLINEVAAASQPLILVLDDYHVIEAAEIHQGVSYLIEHLPTQMHIVIATRADPPLPLSRLRARNALVELRAADLAFTPQESADFLKETMQLDLADNDLAALANRTQGWVAALQMAALALQYPRPPQGDEEEPNVVQGLARTQRYMLDYLTDEVLSQQPEPIEAFLLTTSILDRLSAPLCDALLEEAPPGDQSAGMVSSELLALLDRSNLFVYPLDEALTHYRYHPLFAELLRKRLTDRHPDLVPRLHRRASAWYASQGLIADAIDHALAAADFERAADLVEAHIETTLMRSENRTALGWLTALPDDLIDKRPTLCVYHAWGLLMEGRSPRQVAERLARAKQERNTDEVKGAAMALEAMLAVYQADLSGSIRLAKEALVHLPASTTFLRSVGADVLGIAHTSLGNLASAKGAFERVMSIAEATGNTMMHVAVLCNLAGVQMVRGQLRAASHTYRQALTMSTESHGQRLPVASRALMGLGELSREWNDLEAAADHLTEALKLYERYGEIGSIVCYLTLARVSLAQGRIEVAHELTDKAEAIATASHATQLDDRLVAMSRARLWVAEGQIDKAVGWAQSRGLTPGAVESAPLKDAADYNLHEAERVILA